VSEADAVSGDPGRLALDPSQRLSPQIARLIREMIMRGELSGQSALRTEHLAARFGVSATPVREALMSLSGEGLVEFRPGRGFRVLPMSRQDLIDIYDAQAYFAGELAGRAALHLTDRDIEQLYVMQRAIVAAIDRGDAEAERIEWELHTLINRIARADKLSWLLRSAAHYAPFRAWSSVTGWSEAAPEDHLPLLRGLSHRSPRTARDAMTAHIRNVGELLANHLTERGILVEDPTPVTETRSRIEGIPGPWPLDPGGAAPR
jgi:DNA-binding GntR family transcriptional regulator